MPLTLSLILALGLIQQSWSPPTVDRLESPTEERVRHDYVCDAETGHVDVVIRRGRVSILSHVRPDSALTVERIERWNRRLATLARYSRIEVSCQGATVTSVDIFGQDEGGAARKVAALWERENFYL
ncbi:hypothetical protein [Brevundimonas subvibrioides]|uniref:hypothetical protein n=1 Tax=Brevundimonas subvibrioides TaxID=74313 RepID=UPI0022B33655|nr:hypothetical protein [Brevundimonas subvibrioides]